jgi:aspartyl/glutamyl-tRNA(Asn/Gln) amidotransferase C subunit
MDSGTSPPGRKRRKGLNVVDSRKDGTGVPGGRQAGRYTFSMRIDEVLIARVAALASLELTDAERGAMAEQLTRIVDHFEALREIPDELLAGEEPPVGMPLRADAEGACLEVALVEANAPEFAHGHFVVPRVVTRD